MIFPLFISARTAPAFIIETSDSLNSLNASVIRLQREFSFERLICVWESLDSVAFLYTLIKKSDLPMTSFNLSENELYISIMN